MIAIVIPTFNERENITPLLREVQKYQPQAHIVVVDDNSPDGTREVVQRAQKTSKKIHLINRTNDRGRGASVLTGFAYVLKKLPHAEFIFEMDSDFSHKPSEIKRLLEKAQSNIVVIGSRYVEGSHIVDWPLKRVILSKCANWYIRMLLGIPIRDYTMGFRCYSREALEILQNTKIKHRGFITLSETAYRLHQRGFKFIEVPITLNDRTKGRSNATMREVLWSFLAILQMRLHP